MPLMELPPSLRRAIDALARDGGRPLLVGGLVRDALLGQPPEKDYDVEVYGLTLDELVERLGDFGRVHQVGRSFGVLKLRLDDGAELDVSLPRLESKRGRGHRGFLVTPDPSLTPEQAASRRDFTINAMAWDPLEDRLIDPFGGREDLRDKRLRHVGPAFAEDPLRVLRGFQLAARFDLEASPETLRLCRTLLDEHDTLAPERVWGEWWKWAARASVPSRGLVFLEQCGWLCLYPEVEALIDCPQEPAWHPEGDVFRHTALVADAAARIARRDALAPQDRVVLLLAALTHDLGKPATTLRQGGRVRSPGHAERDDLMESFLRRIGTPERLRRRVIVLGRFHLTHLGFADSKRHVRRLARALGEAGETIPMLARLVEADGSGRPPLPGGMPDEMARLLEVAHEVAADEAAPPRILLGRHLIAEGVEPGPEMGQMLDEAYEAQLDGAFDDLEGALRWWRERHG